MDTDRAGLTARIAELEAERAELTATVDRLRAERAELTRIEEMAVDRSNVLASINRLLRQVLTCETEEEAARLALAVAQELTASRFGFICEINPRGRLDTIAISDTGWHACRVATGELLLAGDLPIRGIRGRVIREERGLIFNDPASDPAWIEPPEGHPPVTAFLGVPLRLGDRVVGEIGLANKEGGYGPRDLEAIEALSATITEALAGKRAEDRLRSSLREKGVLLREVHHRVKNNLQVISSLLNLQSRGAEDPEVVEMFRESRNRVRSMAMTHEQLYRSQDLARVDFRRYLQDLSSSLTRAYGVDPRRIRLLLDVDRVSLPLELAVPLGLIVNELISNCLKHAFPEERQGEVRIAISQQEGRLEMLVADDGVGLPLGFDPGEARTLGLRLVRSLADQAGATMQVDGRAGTTFRIGLEATGDDGRGGGEAK